MFTLSTLGLYATGDVKRVCFSAYEIVVGWIRLSRFFGPVVSGDLVRVRQIPAVFLLYPW